MSQQNRRQHRRQQRIIIVKLGGSSITDKSKYETSNQKALDWVRNVLSQNIHPSFLCNNNSDLSGENDIDSMNKPAFIIIHGAGSFGHYHAKKFGLRGESQPPSKESFFFSKTTATSSSSSSSSLSTNHYMTGLAHTRNSVKTLNNIVVSTLLSSKSRSSSLSSSSSDEHQTINAIGISPCMNIPSLQAHGGSSHSVSILIQSIKEALQVGLVPVLHGDAGLYGFFDSHDANDNKDSTMMMRSGILGGDTLVEIIATSPLWDYTTCTIDLEKNKDDDQHHQIPKYQQTIDKVVFLTDVDGVYTKDPNLYPDDAKLLQTIEIDPRTGEIDSVKIKNDNKNKQCVNNNVVSNDGNGQKETIGSLEIIGSSHEHDVTGGLKAKLGSAAVVAKAGIEVQIVRCSSKSAEQILRGEDNADFGTTIRRKHVHE